MYWGGRVWWRSSTVDGAYLHEMGSLHAVTGGNQTPLYLNERMVSISRTADT